jgi:serine protease Do
MKIISQIIKSNLMNMKRNTLNIYLFLFIFSISCNADGSNNELYQESTKEIKVNKNNEINNSRRNAITNAIDLVGDAVVGINVTEVKNVLVNPDPWARFFGFRGYVEQYEVQGLGSGFLISSDGYILTNNHVAGNAEKIVITLTGGERYDAQIIGADPLTDIALLKIDAEKELPYIKMADSDNLIIGEWAIAMGNPFGLFDVNANPTVTVGVISNKGMNFIEKHQNADVIYRDMIQTDAAISSGNSGGPLINAEGKVIGMNTMIFSTSQSRAGSGSIGIGFAIPINRVKKIIDKFNDSKIIDRDFYLGIEIKEIDSRISEYFGLGNMRGVVIFAMRNDSPALEAGLEPGDIILEIDGHRILRGEDYKIIVNDAFVGQTLNFLILRDNNKKEIKLTLKRSNQKRYKRR